MPRKFNLTPWDGSETPAKKGSSTVCATNELESEKIRRRNIKLPMCRERGTSRRPHVPSRAERRPRDDVGVAVGDFVCGMLCVCRKSELAGCGHAGVQYANGFHGKLRCSGDLPPGHAAYAPLASWRLPKPPLRALFWARRDSPALPAHGRCRPVTPASLLFAGKEGKQEKRRL